MSRTTRRGFFAMLGLGACASLLRFKPESLTTTGPRIIESGSYPLGDSDALNEIFVRHANNYLAQDAEFRRTGRWPS